MLGLLEHGIMCWASGRIVIPEDNTATGKEPAD